MKDEIDAGIVQAPTAIAGAVLGATQIAFLTLKLSGAVDWEWPIVLLPTIIVAAAFVVLLTMFLFAAFKLSDDDGI